MFLSNHVVCRWFPLTSGLWWRHFRFPWRHFRFASIPCWPSGTRTQTRSQTSKIISSRGQVTWYKIQPSDWSKFEMLHSDWLGLKPFPYSSVMNFLYVWILCWFYQFSDRIQKFSSNQIFRQPKLSVDLNFRVVSGFGDLFEFPTSFEHFTSPIRFWWIFCQ